jgi:hypothetical protein
MEGDAEKDGTAKKNNKIKNTDTVFPICLRLNKCIHILPYSSIFEIIIEIQIFIEILICRHFLVNTNNYIYRLVR